MSPEARLLMKHSLQLMDRRLLSRLMTLVVLALNQPHVVTCTFLLENPINHVGHYDEALQIQSFWKGQNR